MSLCILLLSLILPLSTTAETAGIQLRVTDKAIRFASEIGIRTAYAKMRGRELPGFEKQKDVFMFGTTRLVVSNVRVDRFERPEFEHALEVPNRVRWSTAAGYTKVVGSFWTCAWCNRVHGGGSFTIETWNLRLYMSATLNQKEDGRAEILASPDDCTTEIQSLRVTVYDTRAGWIFKLFKSLFESSIRRMLEGEFCTKGTQLLSDFTNERLSAVPVEGAVDADRNWILDSRLVSNPRVSTKHIDAFLRGETFWRPSQEQRAPALLAGDFPLLPSTETSRMFYVRVSEFVINSLFYHAHRVHKMRDSVTSARFPERRKSLSTSCEGRSVCAGRVSEKIPTAYPNSHIQVHWTSATVPTCTFHANPPRASLSAVFSWEMCVEQTSVNESTGELVACVPLLGGFANLKGDAGVSLRGNSVHVTLNTSETEMRDFNITTRSAIFESDDDISVGEVERGARKLVAFMLNVRMRTHLNFKIPVADGVLLVEPRLSLRDHFVQVDTDIAYEV